MEPLNVGPGTFTWKIYCPRLAAFCTDIAKAKEERRDIAEELYSALEAMVAAETSGSGANMARARRKARDVLAKARGEA